MGEVQAAKAYWSANHLQGARLVREGHEHRWRLAEIVAAHEPTSVLEFGCASGRNLAVLREVMGSAVELTGLDMNETTLGRAREAHPDMAWVLGDEHKLELWPEGRFDVVMTSSCLDHIPHPHWQAVYDGLVRLARKAVVIHEPITSYSPVPLPGAEYDFSDGAVRAAPFSYAHDYLSHDPRLRSVMRLPIAQTEQFMAFGDLYVVLIREKESADAVG